MRGFYVPMGRTCEVCGASVTPYDEAVYYCKKCKVFECQAHGEWHEHDDLLLENGD